MAEYPRRVRLAQSITAWITISNHVFKAHTHIHMHTYAHASTQQKKFYTKLKVEAQKKMKKRINSTDRLEDGVLM